MISIVLIGTGNVSRHLFDTFSLSTKIKVVQVVGRNEKALRYFSNVSTTTKFNTVADADLYIIAVTDDAITKVSKSIGIRNGLVVHTSGSVAMNALSHYNTGVLYPLQTFSKDKKVDFKTVPLCIETEKKTDFKLLKEVAESLSKSVYEISSKQRKTIHLAAVFANNFTNQLYHISHEICEQNDVPFNILKPLIKETTKKLETLKPIEAQTGPAKRNDQETLERHLAQLDSSEYKDLYRSLTKSIQKTHGKKL